MSTPIPQLLQLLPPDTGTPADAAHLRAINALMKALRFDAFIDEGTALLPVPVRNKLADDITELLAEIIKARLAPGARALIEKQEATITAALKPARAAPVLDGRTARLKAARTFSARARALRDALEALAEAIKQAIRDDIKGALPEVQRERRPRLVAGALERLDEACKTLLSTPVPAITQRHLSKLPTRHEELLVRIDEWTRRTDSDGSRSGPHKDLVFSNWFAECESIVRDTSDLIRELS